MRQWFVLPGTPPWGSTHDALHVMYSQALAVLPEEALFSNIWQFVVNQKS